MVNAERRMLSDQIQKKKKNNLAKNKRLHMQKMTSMMKNDFKRKEKRE